MSNGWCPECRRGVTASDVHDSIYGLGCVCVSGNTPLQYFPQRESCRAIRYSLRVATTLSMQFQNSKVCIGIGIDNCNQFRNIRVGIGNHFLTLRKCWPPRPPETPRNSKSLESDSKGTFGVSPQVTLKVTPKATLGETPKVTFEWLSSDFEFLGVSGVLGGQHFLNPNSESYQNSGLFYPSNQGGRCWQLGNYFQEI